MFLTGWIVWVVEVQMVEVERDDGQGVVAFLGGTKVEALLVVQADVIGLGGGMVDLLVVQAEVTGLGGGMVDLLVEQAEVTGLLVVH